MRQPTSAIIARKVLGQGVTGDGQIVLLFETEAGTAEALVVSPTLLPDLFNLVTVATGQLSKNDEGATFMIPTSGLEVGLSEDGRTAFLRFSTTGGGNVRLAVDAKNLLGVGEAITAAATGRVPGDGRPPH